MFKITNETFGQITVKGKSLKYKQFIVVKELDDVIIRLIQNKVVKSKQIEEELKVMPKIQKNKTKRSKKKKQEEKEEDKQDTLIPEEEI